jgi:hypothetical protein
MAGVTPAPGTPQTGTKAVVAAGLSFVGTFIFALWQAVSDKTDLDSMTNTQWLIVVLGALATSFATGGFTYAVQNKAK